MTSYGSWSLKQLREELKRRNARVTGRKGELVERLEAYDRTYNFGQNEFLQKEFNMEIPPMDSYKDLHSDMTIPHVLKENVTAFLDVFDCSVESKADGLYQERYIKFIRSSSQQNVSFFQASVQAEMKTGVCYKTDICVSKELMEAQCECAAGMGPNAHCKHVRCVLLGFMDFAKARRTYGTGTQQLQAFHNPGKHLGSPVKAEHLSASRLQEVDFDPRPPVFRNSASYTALFFTGLINSQVFTGAPISHCIMPANPYALVYDHDYFKEHPEERFLKSMGLLNISNQQRQTVQAETVVERKRWQEERKKGICSSDFGTISKLTSRADKIKLSCRLLSTKDVKTPAVLHGRKHEPAAVKAYEHATGNNTSACGLFISQTSPYLASTPDRVISKSHFLEVKCPKSACGQKITPQTVPYLEINDGKLRLKRNHDYFYQVQGQMFVSERRRRRLML